jgi:radical SAM superfamily enzyme YgiQ (UPF0313 family)
MGLAYISAVLKQHNHKVILFDTCFISDKEIINEVKKSDIQLLMFSVHSMAYNHAIELSSRIKTVRPDIYTLFGGWHILIDPDDVINNDSVDMLCIGEGEYAALDVADNIDRLDTITNIPNIWFKHDGKVIKNEVRVLENLDKLPYPDRELFDVSCLSDSNGLFHFITMRGCPYNCSFCCNYKMIDLYKDIGCRYIRFRSIDSCIKEMLFLKKVYSPKEFFFTDEMFLTDHNRVKEFCKKYIENKVGIPFGFMARVEHITEELLRILKDAGCNRIHLGIESGNEQLRRKYLNRHMTNEQIIDAFDLCHRYGLYTASFNMIGLPFETKETIKDTFDLNKRCNPTVFQITILYPFHGTKIRDIYQNNNLLDTYGEEHNRKDEYYYSCITKNKTISFSYIKHQQVFMNIYFNYSKLFANISLYLPLFLLKKYNAGLSMFYEAVKK